MVPTTKLDDLAQKGDVEDFEIDRPDRAYQFESLISLKDQLRLTFHSEKEKAFRRVDGSRSEVTMLIGFDQVLPYHYDRKTNLQVTKF